MTRQFNPTIDFKIGDTRMDEHFWSTYSLIPQPASLRRQRMWPLYLGLMIIGAVLTLLVVKGVGA